MDSAIYTIFAVMYGSYAVAAILAAGALAMPLRDPRWVVVRCAMIIAALGIAVFAWLLDDHDNETTWEPAGTGVPAPIKQSVR